MSKNSHWILTLILIAAPAHAQVYKSVDPQGNVTYSSSPPNPGSAEIVKQVEIDPPPSQAEQQEAEQRIKRIERESARTDRQRREQADSRKEAATDTEKTLDQARIALEEASVKRDSDWQYLSTGGRVLKQSYLDRVKRAEQQVKAAEDSARKARRGR